MSRIVMAVSIDLLGGQTCEFNLDIRHDDTLDVSSAVIDLHYAITCDCMDLDDRRGITLAFLRDDNKEMITIFSENIVMFSCKVEEYDIRDIIYTPMNDNMIKWSKEYN